MDKSNLELFKQALNEAVSNKFDKMADECTEEIVYSEKHKLAMRTIVYGKTDNKRVWSPKMKRIIAILIAAALLLTSCGIIFRNEIREIFKDFFVSLTYEGGEESNETIKEVYSLGYVPEGYILDHEIIATTYAKYKFINTEGDVLCFEQRLIISSDFVIDSESGYSKIAEIAEYEIYTRSNDNKCTYIWTDRKYAMTFIANKEILNEELVLLIKGITIR